MSVLCSFLSTMTLPTRAVDEFFTEIKDSLHELKKTVEAQNLVIKHQERKIKELEKNNAIQQEMFELQRQNTAALRKRMEREELLTDRFRVKLETLQQNVANRTNLESIMKRFLFLQQDFHTRAVDTDFVAFQAVILRAFTPHLQGDQHIVFDQGTLNLGGGFDFSTGIFTAPLPGVYVLSTAVTMARMSSDRNCHVVIEKNGSEIAGAYVVDPENGNALFHQSSVTVVEKLDVGDQVYVNVERHDDIQLYGDRLTSFMGCLCKDLNSSLTSKLH